ncbi:hypothetical protein BaRGS_00004529 [Batillaria attramentaria]|uniref:Uncharacterized protein n=1 Tax=Batillaria attramentaria TaxID=370345 RepID=A0ABD0LYH1_9CAEN
MITNNTRPRHEVCILWDELFPSGNAAENPLLYSSKLNLHFWLFPSPGLYSVTARALSISSRSLKWTEPRAGGDTPAFKARAILSDDPLRWWVAATFSAAESVCVDTKNCVESTFCCHKRMGKYCLGRVWYAITGMFASLWVISIR